MNKLAKLTSIVLNYWCTYFYTAHKNDNNMTIQYNPYGKDSVFCFVFFPKKSPVPFKPLIEHTDHSGQMMFAIVRCVYSIDLEGEVVISDWN